MRLCPDCGKPLRKQVKNYNLTRYYCDTPIEECPVIQVHYTDGRHGNEKITKVKREAVPREEALTGLTMDMVERQPKWLDEQI